MQFDITIIMSGGTVWELLYKGRRLDSQYFYASQGTPNPYLVFLSIHCNSLSPGTGREI